MTDTAFQVKIPQYSGPFDLLLENIKEDKLDIFEISLTEIVSSFFDYLHSQTTIDLSSASEFLLICSILLEMKSKLVLPQPEDLAMAKEEEDIENDLLKHLEEYKVFKMLAEGLRSRGATFRKVFSRYHRGEASNLEKIEYSFKDVSLTALVEAFKRVWDSIPQQKQLHHIQDEDVTLPQRIEEITDMIKRSSSGVAFESLFIRRTRLEVVVTFLAILELAKRRMIKILQGGNFGGITIKSN